MRFIRPLCDKVTPWADTISLWLQISTLILMAWDLTVDSRISRTISFLSLLASRVFSAYSAILKVDAVNKEIFQLAVGKEMEYNTEMPKPEEATPLTAPLLITLEASYHDLNVHQNRREPHGPLINYIRVTSVERTDPIMLAVLFLGLVVQFVLVQLQQLNNSSINKVAAGCSILTAIALFTFSYKLKKNRIQDLDQDRGKLLHRLSGNSALTGAASVVAYVRQAELARDAESSAAANRRLIDLESGAAARTTETARSRSARSSPRRK